MTDLFFPLALGCVVAVCSALAVVVVRRPVYAAISLLVHSLSLAALFALLAAPMVAVGPLLIAFELTAPLLLVAMVGAVVIWRRHEPRPRIAAKPTTATAPRRLVMHR